MLFFIWKVKFKLCLFQIRYVVWIKNNYMYINNFDAIFMDILLRAMKALKVGAYSQFLGC